MSKRISHPSRGFTIIELLIATTVFAVVLLLLTIGTLQISNRYYKTTLQSRTQAAARNIVDEISRGIQFSGVEPDLSKDGSPTGAYCINGVQYSFKKLSIIATGQHALVAQNTPSCNAPPAALFTNPLPAGARDMLTENMRLQKFIITKLPADNTYGITVKVISATDTDLLENPSDPDTTCKPGAGSHFCAVSELSTIVQKRIL